VVGGYSVCGQQVSSDSCEYLQMPIDTRRYFLHYLPIRCNIWDTFSWLRPDLGGMDGSQKPSERVKAPRVVMSVLGRFPIPRYVPSPNMQMGHSHIHNYRLITELFLPPLWYHYRPWVPGTFLHGLFSAAWFSRHVSS